jgi:hypothetical protein
MGRSPRSGNESPLELIVQFSRHYVHGRRKVHDRLWFFSKYKPQCDKLLVFGGHVYRQYGGWVWILSNRKNLLALCKLIEPIEHELTNPSLHRFMKRMKRRHLRVYNK